jgi:hypothetical protein
MPNIKTNLDQKSKINAAHVEYTRATGSIEVLIEGPPVFSGGTVATGCTWKISQGFADFLKAKGILD